MKKNKDANAGQRILSYDLHETKAQAYGLFIHKRKIQIALLLCWICLIVGIVYAIDKIR